MNTINRQSFPEDGMGKRPAGDAKSLKSRFIED